ncbi:MAG: hypothetical protein Q9181_005046 [Wetmoreana brouardii]
MEKRSRVSPLPRPLKSNPADLRRGSINDSPKRLNNIRPGKVYKKDPPPFLLYTFYTVVIESFRRVTLSRSSVTMAIIKNVVAKSNNTHAAALNLNAKTFELRQTLAGIWDLKPTATAPPPPQSSFQLDMKNHTDESVFGEGDERVKVDKKHFMPGGKYRSIAKLFIHYEFQEPGKWAMGTGWLIKPDILVTAGHCSYDWSHNLGRATEVKAYIGYQGDASVKHPDTQFRSVKRIVTTEGWLKGRGAKNFDVSFMQVEEPFAGVTPIVYSETPESGEYTIGVVGYPGDLKDPSTGEKGAYMYEMFLEISHPPLTLHLKTRYDLATQADTMLEYQIDTYGGNSGSPVLRHPKMDSIGAHVYGGTYNSASVIGRYGNPYDDYLMGFNVRLANDGLNIVPVRAKSDAVPNPYYRGNEQVTTKPGINGANGRRYQGQEHSSVASRSLTVPQSPSNRGYRQNDAESFGDDFLNIIKSAVKISAPALGGALKTGLPIALGPLGGPIGALAGMALDAAGKLAESTDAESFDPSEARQGTMERAILAEAAFTAIQNMNMHPDEQESIFSDMKEYVMKSMPTIRKVAPHVMGAMMEPALRIAMNSLHNYNQNGYGGAEAFEDHSGEPFRLNASYSTRINQRGDRNTEAFIQGLRTAIGQKAIGDQESEEGFFDVITTGCRSAGLLQKNTKMMNTGAAVGLTALAKVVGDVAPPDWHGESTGVGSGAPSALSSTNLANRALVSEAALQALIKLPPRTLEEEGFFDVIADNLRKIAPVVARVAPIVFKNLTPVVGNLIKAATGQEAVFAYDQSQGCGQPSLSAKRSHFSLRGRKTGGNDFMGQVSDWHAGLSQ